MTNGRFTEGKILGTLVRFMLPVLFALCLQAMYGAVDLMVVGWFGTEADVSAVSTGSQILQTVTGIITGLAMGATIVLGHKLGEGRADEAGDVIGATIILFSAVALIVTGLMLAFASPLARLMRAPEEALSRTVEYVRVCSSGAVFIVAYNVLGSVFRGLGDSKTPLMAVGVACVCNIAGDLLFVGVFHMAAGGAALATVLSQGVSVALCVFVVSRRGLPFRFSMASIRPHRRLCASIFKLGFPIALQDTLVSISFLVILAIVNGLGLIASAGVGVAEKVCAFIMLIPSAFSQSLSAFVAQNVGANRLSRANRAALCGMLLSFGVGAVMAWLTFFHGDILSRAFAGDRPEVVAAAADYLKAYAIDTLLVSFLFCFIGYYNGRGCTRFVMAQGLCGAFGVRIPVSFLMSARQPVRLFYVGLATPCSTLVQIALCAAFFLWLRKKSARDPCVYDVRQNT